MSELLENISRTWWSSVSGILQGAIMVYVWTTRKRYLEQAISFNLVVSAVEYSHAKLFQPWQREGTPHMPIVKLYTQLYTL